MKKLFKITISVFCIISCLTGCVKSDIIDNGFNMAVSTTYKDLGLEDIIEDVNIEYFSDIDIVSEVNNDKKKFDAILISNSMWTYMLDNVYLTESKSLANSPVVFGIKMKKAEELGLKDKEITNNEILDLVKNGSFKYVMPSAVRTNSGATSYLGFVNALAGNPEVLTEEMINDENLKEQLNILFGNVERNTGDEVYAFDMLKTGECEGLVSTEASIIKWNLENPDNKLYMLYPIDGVPMTDGMITFIGGADKKDKYLEIREILSGEKGNKCFENNYFRTWYGGAKKTDENIFKKEWGIDTEKTLKITSFPSKKVMDSAFNLYITTLRKKAFTVFVLDYSGSMYGDGYKQLQDAMNYLLHTETSSKEYLQFSDEDVIGVVLFTDGDIYKGLWYGNESDKIYDDYLVNIYTGGGTPLYEAAVEALNVIDTNKAGDEYNYSIVLMTDGADTGKRVQYFIDEYDEYGLKIPVYSVAFGSAVVSNLERIAEYSNGKFFDGRRDLFNAFREIRGYN